MLILCSCCILDVLMHSCCLPAGPLLSKHEPTGTPSCFLPHGPPASRSWRPSSCRTPSRSPLAARTCPPATASRRCASANQLHLSLVCCSAVPLCPPLQLQRPSGVLPCKLLRQLSSASLNQTSKYTAHAACSALLCSLSAANCAVD